MRRSLILFNALSVAISTAAGIAMLYVGDHFTDDFVYKGQPSLIQNPTYTWLYLFPWIFAATAVVGVTASVASAIIYKEKNVLQGFAITSWALVAISIIQSYVALRTFVPISDYLIAVGARLIFLFVMGCLGLMFGNIVGFFLASPFMPRRSTVDIMPSELKAQIAQEHAAQVHESPIARVRHFFGQGK